MSVDRFDVYVDPPDTATSMAADQMKLAGSIAARFRIPAPQVAEAMARGRFRIGKGLDSAAAERIMTELVRLGANAFLHPAGEPPPRVRPARSSSGGPEQGTVVERPVAKGGAAPQGAGGSGGLPRPEGVPRMAPLAPSSGPNALGSSGTGGKGPTTGGRDPFLPPDLQSGPVNTGLELARSPGPNPSGPRPTGARAVVKTDGKDEMTLDEGLGGGIFETRVTPSRAKSGLALLDKDGNPQAVKCPRHGLVYDQTKASGCRRCLEPARQMAQEFERRTQQVRLGDLEGNPAKRAFLGLALALFLGFIPAFYYARVVNGGEVEGMRAEQVELSSRPGTPSVLQQFEELDDRVGQSHRRGAFQTVIIWLGVAGLVGFGFYKIT